MTLADFEAALRSRDGFDTHRRAAAQRLDAARDEVLTVEVTNRPALHQAAQNAIAAIAVCEEWDVPLCSEGSGS